MGNIKYWHRPNLISVFKAAGHSSGMHVLTLLRAPAKATYSSLRTDLGVRPGVSQELREGVWSSTSHPDREGVRSSADKKNQSQRTNMTTHVRAQVKQSCKSEIHVAEKYHNVLSCEPYVSGLKVNL